MLLPIFFVINLLLLSGCSNESINQPNQSTDQMLIGTAYPAFDSVTEEPINTSPGYPPPLLPLTQKELASLKVPDPELTDYSMGSISGMLINGFQSTQMGNTDIYLAKGTGPENNLMPPVLAGSLLSRGDIRGKTLDRGDFFFTNIPPGNYFLVVSMDLSPVVSSIEENVPLMIVIEEGNIYNLGVVYYTAK